VIDCDPSALTVLTRIKTRAPFPLYDGPANRVQHAAEITAKDANAYMIFNRLELFYSRVSNPLRNALTQREPAYAETLLLMIPMVDLDIYTHPLSDKFGFRCTCTTASANHWCCVEKWCADTVVKLENQHIIDAMVRSARERLEDYRNDRAVCVLQLAIDGILPLVVCELINAYGQRPECK
jgi:hypothetical protein